MTSRERVMKTLNLEKTDCIPFDIGGTDCSSIHALPYQNLRKKLGLDDGTPVTCGCLVQLIASPDRKMREALGVDVEMLLFGSQKSKVWRAPFGVDIVVPDKFDLHQESDGATVAKNPKGAIYAKRAANSCYFDPVGTPLAGVTSVKDLDDFGDLFDRWDYSYVYDESMADFGKRAAAQYKATDKAVAAMWRLHFLQSGQLMRGYEQFFIDLMVDKDLAHAIMDKLLQVYLKRIDMFLKATAGSFDIVFLTDDLGTQEAGMVSLDLYREMLFPYMAKVVRKIKAAGKKVVMHTCGSVPAFIPSLIEMGVDAVNPVQVSAKGMNPRDLVREFGRDIAFWGGGCDTQHALNSRDLGVVRKDVRQRLEEFGPDAHLVFTQVHNIQYDVPPENILALRDEFRKIARS